MTPALIGLTGTVGAGKSSALEALERLGAVTISSDAVVHELLGTDELRDELVAHWGEDVAPGGVVDRKRVAAIVFEDPDQLEWLESRLHPRVGERIADWAAGLDPDLELAIVEVPLLFETGMTPLFDAVLGVVAPPELRQERAAERGLGQLEGRGVRQLSDEEKAARSDFVVENTGSIAELEARLSELLPRLVKAGE